MIGGNHDPFERYINNMDFDNDPIKWLRVTGTFFEMLLARTLMRQFESRLEV